MPLIAAVDQVFGRNLFDILRCGPVRRCRRRGQAVRRPSFPAPTSCATSGPAICVVSDRHRRRSRPGRPSDASSSASVSCAGQACEPLARVHGRGALSEFHIKRFRVAPARAIWRPEPRIPPDRRSRCGPAHQAKRSIGGNDLSHLAIQGFNARRAPGDSRLRVQGSSHFRSRGAAPGSGSWRARAR